VAILMVNRGDGLFGRDAMGGKLGRIFFRRVTPISLDVRQRITNCKAKKKLLVTISSLCHLFVRMATEEVTSPIVRFHSPAEF